MASIIATATTGLAQRPVLDIDGAYFRPFPIAIPDLRAKSNEAKVSAEIASVVRNDLALTGLFHVLDPRSFIASQQREGVTVGTIDFPAWLNVGADGLVKGVVTQQGNKTKVEIHIFDVIRARETLRTQIQVEDEQPRRIAHRLADLLLQHYSGETGLFRSRIAYVQRSGRGKSICIMDVDGHNANCVVKNGVINLLPAWDGNRGLLFTSYLRGNTDLFRVTLGSNSVTQVSARPGLNSGAAMSPNGKTIALTLSQDGNSEIYLLDSAGKNPRRLTRESFAIDSSPTWSPDGKRIAFVSDRAGTPQIYTMGMDGSSQKRLTFQGNYNQTPAWSPRGDLIAFTARDERNVFDIFTIHLATGKVTRITQDQGNNEEPTWSPNGRMLVFVSDRSGRKAVYIADAEGNHQRRISRGTASCYTPSWSPLLK